MILYHGSNVKVKTPIIVKTDKGRDFGYAFYLTSIKEQAERMAKRKQKINDGSPAVVSVFEWDEIIDHLKYRKFANPDLDWLEMIIKCRNNVKYNHGYDIVEGKIADDAVGETILFVVDGIIKPTDALERLKFQKINSQFAFCTEEALHWSP